MIIRPQALPALILLPVVAALTQAQAQPAADAESPPEPNAVEAVAAEEAEVAVDPTLRELPPDDYKASEQISEDLSVSFPVDI